jgi:hypothetical protein
VATNLSAAGFVDSGLNNGTTYYYVISALNTAGESGNSSQVYAIPGSLNRTIWVASSSTTGSDDPGNALDGVLTTRWSTGASQANGQWFQVDMGTVNAFNKIVLNEANSANDYPRGYEVMVSNDGVNWSSSIATGVGTSGVTTITFTTQAARYIRITQTGSAPGTFWSIHEFNVFGTVPFAPTGLTAAALGNQITLAWTAAAGASGYNVKRASTSGGAYATVASNLSELSYVDAGLAAGVNYYYVVSGTNSLGESGNSSEAVARTVSVVSPQINFAATNGQMQFAWPVDHLGWHLEVQTNPPGGGMGTNWTIVAGSTATNQMTLPLDAESGSVFFRLVYP